MKRLSTALIVAIGLFVTACGGARSANHGSNAAIGGPAGTNGGKKIDSYSLAHFNALPLDQRAQMCSAYFSSKDLRSIDPNYNTENGLPSNWEFFGSAGFTTTGPEVALDKLVFGQLAVTHDSNTGAAKNAAGCVFQLGTPGYAALLSKIDNKDTSTIPPLVSGNSYGIQRQTWGSCTPFNQGNFAGFDAGGLATQVVAAENYTTGAAADYVFQYVTSTDSTSYPIAILLGTIPSSDPRFIQGADLEVWHPQ